MAARSYKPPLYLLLRRFALIAVRLSASNKLKLVLKHSPEKNFLKKRGEKKSTANNEKVLKSKYYRSVASLISFFPF
jgi:hypothetical protein